MTREAVAETGRAKQSSGLSRTTGSVLQRQCACGTHTLPGGTCSECSGRQRQLQRHAVNPKANDLGHSSVINQLMSTPLEHRPDLVTGKSSQNAGTDTFLHGRVGSIRPKLSVNGPGDIYEQEADRVAEQVMSKPGLKLSGAPTQVHELSSGPTGEMRAAPASVERVLADIGSPLDFGIRQDMEQRFGHDFSRVRVHADPAAAQSAQDVNAKAYTVGHDIVFGENLFMPGTHEGRQLLAHELTHVVQQSKEAPHIQRDVLSHVDADDTNFWGTLKGEVKSDYGLWLGQYDRIFRGFVSIIGKETSIDSVTWKSTIRAWIGVGGVYGDIANAVLETTDLAAKSLEEQPAGKKLTLGDLEKIVITDLNILTERVRNTDSNLPLYKIIDSKQSQEKNLASEARRDFRLSVRTELARVLERLPSPEGIKKELILRWINPERVFEPSRPTILYGAEYDLRQGSPKEVAVSEGEVVYGRSWFRGPVLADIEKPKNIIEALKDGFGENFPLHQLPIRFVLRIVVRNPVPYKKEARYLDWVGSYVKQGNRWVPTEGLGSELLSELVGLWLKSGKKPTLSELIPSNLRAKDWE